MKQFFVAAGLVGLLLPSSAYAQTTVTFQGRVTAGTNGVDAGLFTPGDPISVSYTLNTNVPDNNADPQAGVFFNATQGLSVSFPKLNAFAVGTTGNVQTFDNIGDPVSDQVFFFGGGISSSSLLGGSAIAGIEVDFLSEFTPAPANPTMLSSDAIPTFVPQANQAFVIIDTANGTTFVHFEVGPSVQMLANGSHGPVTIAAGAPMKIEMKFDAPGTGLAAANVAVGVVTPSGVVWVGPAGLTTTATLLYSGPLPDFGPATLVNYASTAGFPAGTYRWFAIIQDTATGQSAFDVVDTIIR